MELNQKLFPTDDIDNLLPPVLEYSYLYEGREVKTEYEYFENGAAHPFDTSTSGYSLLNAWWLGDAAMLAYSDPTLIRAACEKAGFTEVDWFSGLTTQCYVAACREFVIVAFRGTQSPCRNQPALEVAVDWLTDFRMRLVPFEGEGRIHEGFHSALAEVWSDLSDRLQTLQTQDPMRKVWFTGHSLGAALATVAAARYEKPAGLYTFGSPMVGDADFGRWFQSRFPTGAWRFINNMDIIARLPNEGIYHPVKLPPAGHYQPVGELKFIDADGRVGTTEKASPDTSGLYKYLRDHFADHSPLRYQIHIWNQYISKFAG